MSLCLALVALAAVSPVTVSAQELVFADGFELGLPGGWSAVQGLIPADSFRAEDLDLRDPHVWVDAGLLGCVDFTDSSVLGIAPSFNQQLATAITSDDNGDGLLDLSILLLHRPLDLSGQGLALEIRSGACTAPASSTSCGPDPVQPPGYTTYDTFGATTCLQPLPGTTGGYSPAIAEPLAPCFVSEPRDLVLSFSGLDVPLTEGQVAATFVGDPAQQLVSGLVTGFLREADADATPLPADLPLIGGQPLSSILPGGAGCCAPHDDRDLLDLESGWWFYVNLEAARVVYTAP